MTSPSSRCRQGSESRSALQVSSHISAEGLPIRCLISGTVNQADWYTGCIIVQKFEPLWQQSGMVWPCMSHETALARSASRSGRSPPEWGPVPCSCCSTSDQNTAVRHARAAARLYGDLHLAHVALLAIQTQMKQVRRPSCSTKLGTTRQMRLCRG
jgi:hypothetical protein